jgi:hypothetical protein
MSSVACDIQVMKYFGILIETLAAILLLSALIELSFFEVFVLNWGPFSPVAFAFLHIQSIGFLSENQVRNVVVCLMRIFFPRGPV